eukprot:1156802-Pelagomonas_calceolata.AAC.4
MTSTMWMASHRVHRVYTISHQSKQMTARLSMASHPCISLWCSEERQDKNGKEFCDVGLFFGCCDDNIGWRIKSVPCMWRAHRGCLSEAFTLVYR